MSDRFFHLARAEFCASFSADITAAHNAGSPLSTAGLCTFPSRWSVKRTEHFCPCQDAGWSIFAKIAL
jgi:hypothetical protein